MNAANPHLRRALALVLAMAASLAIPASAHAAFAKVDSGKLTFTAVPGEANDLAVTYDAGAFRLAERGHLGPLPVLIAGSRGCSALAAAINCTGAASVVLNLGDGNDWVAARDGFAERIDCGPGADSVIADAEDVAGADCETVDRPSGAAVPTSPGGNDPPPGPATDPEPVPGNGDAAAADIASPFVNIVAPVIPRQTVAVSPSGVAAVQVVCPPTAGSCRGTVALVLVRSAGRARIVAAATPATAIRLGSATFKAAAGTKPIVRIRLNRRGRRRILRSRHTRCRIVVTTRSSDGKVTTTTRDLTLRPRRTARRGR